MQIVEVIRAEGIEMYDKGEYWQGKCPLHGDSAPSLVVYKTGNRFHCFGCGERGDAIDFVKLLKGISFTEAVEYLDIHYSTDQVCIPHLKLIDLIVEEERNGIPVKKTYKELLIAMGWMQEE